MVMFLLFLNSKIDFIISAFLYRIHAKWANFRMNPILNMFLKTCSFSLSTSTIHFQTIASMMITISLVYMWNRYINIKYYDANQNHEYWKKFKICTNEKHRYIIYPAGKIQSRMYLSSVIRYWKYFLLRWNVKCC